MSSFEGRTSHYDQRWADRGNCSGLARRNPELYDHVFFPEKGQPPTHPEYEKYCANCPVRAMCYKYALVNDLDGVWGNSTKAQRDHLPIMMKNIFINEAKELGYLENYASPSVSRRTVVTVIHRDEFVELSEDFLERADFPVQYFYDKYINRVQRLMSAIEDSLTPT